MRDSLPAGSAANTKNQSNDASQVTQLGFSVPIPSPQDDDNSCNSFENGESRVGHQSPRWSEWDGGKLGGRPSWLNPRDLPLETPLRCKNECGKNGGTAMVFIAQLYCPADDATSNPAAFHRSLYVFACPTCCSGASAWTGSGEGTAGVPIAKRLSGCVRVLRCQLPRQNDFYPFSGGGGESGHKEEWARHRSQYWGRITGDDKLNLCSVCHQRSTGKCPKQQLWFCGADHQKEYLRGKKKLRQKTSNFQAQSDDDDAMLKFLPSLCCESELVVEDEPNIGIPDKDSRDEDEQHSKKGPSSLFPSHSKLAKDDNSDDNDDIDANLEQSDLNAMVNIDPSAAGVTDPITLAFYARMAIGGKENDCRDQCLRYSRWPRAGKGTNHSDKNKAIEGDQDEQDGPGPLWLQSDHRPPIHSKTDSRNGESNEEKNPDTNVTKPQKPKNLFFPPPCQYCGASRAFEFQILPQMLYHLNAEPNTNENDSQDQQRTSLTEAQRAILLEAKSKIDSGAELPEGFREQHEAAVRNARAALLGLSGGKNTKEGLDWGTIVIYTCTESCGNGGVVHNGNGEKSLMAYMEEVAWMQPSLD